MLDRKGDELPGIGPPQRGLRRFVWRWLEKVVDAHAYELEGPDGETYVISTPEPNTGFTYVSTTSPPTRRPPRLRRP